jgi:hypothetical protein
VGGGMRALFGGWARRRRRRCSGGQNPWASRTAPMRSSGRGSGAAEALGSPTPRPAPLASVHGRRLRGSAQLYPRCCPANACPRARAPPRWYLSCPSSWRTPPRSRRA